MIKTKKKILFVNDEMHMGGVARVLNNLIAALPKDRYEIDLLVLHSNGMLLNEVPEDITLIEGTSFFHAVDETLKDILKRKDLLHLFYKLRLIFYMKTGLIKKKIQKERKKILSKQYDVEVAAKEGFCTIFTAYGNSKKKINWVLTDYSVCNYSSNHMPLVRHALQHIDLNIADSKEALIAYQTVFRVQNGTVIHNLMDVQRVLHSIHEPVSIQFDQDKINLINVARFHPQKSIDRLLYACKYIQDKGIQYHLYLIGGGTLEEELRQLCKTLQIEENVSFLGYQSKAYAYVSKCDLFVLTSLYEGFATVVNESLISTTPVLMTDVSGASEQILNKTHGWIVANQQDAINQGLFKACQSKSKLIEMKEKLKDYHYPNQKILEQFIDVFS